MVRLLLCRFINLAVCHYASPLLLFIISHEPWIVKTNPIFFLSNCYLWPKKGENNSRHRRSRTALVSLARPTYSQSWSLVIHVLTKCMQSSKCRSFWDFEALKLWKGQSGAFHKKLEASPTGLFFSRPSGRQTKRETSTNLAWQINLDFLSISKFSTCSGWGRQTDRQTSRRQMNRQTPDR